MFIDDITPDKLKHLAAGVILCLSFYMTALFQANHIWALGFCTVIAAGREIQQKINKKGTAEFMDFLYTMVSPIIFYIFTIL